MRRLLIALLLLVASPAWADGVGNSMMGVISGGAAYQGLLDQVSGASAAYSVRLLRAAYAGKALNARRASDNTTQDIGFTGAGDLDTTAAATFAGTDATCTGTISSTTLTVTSCASGTLHVNDPISGVGITQPAYITAIGTCATPPGTCTINAAQTVSVGETITAQVALFVTKWYDQASTHDASNATAAQQPQLLLSATNGRPGLVFNGSSTVLSTGSFASSTSPQTFSVVAMRASGTAYQFAMTAVAANALGFDHTANQAVVFGNAAIVGANATTGTWHSLIGVLHGASSVITVDGTDTTGNDSGDIVASAAINIGNGGAGIQYLNGSSGEEISWGSLALSSGQRVTVQGSQKTYFGTP